MRFRTLSCVLLGAVIAGCAVSPPTEVATLTSTKSMKETAQFLEKQAKACWERSASMWEDGITIDARMSLYDTALVSAARWASDIGIQEPFLVIEVMPESDDTAKVVISEGDYGCGLDGSCHSIDLHKDVVRWLGGDVACKEQEQST